MLTKIKNENFSNEQADQMCTQAAYSFDTDEYHNISKEIIMHIVDSYADELNGLHRLFYDKRVKIGRDKDFLIYLMKSRHGVRLTHAFLYYLKGSTEEITEFADVLYSLSASIISNQADSGDHVAIKDLIQSVIKIYDKGSKNKRVRNICLDIWDNVFKSNMQDIKPVADMLEELSVN